MAFGFPAYHTEDYFSSAETIAELQEAILDVVEDLGWQIRIGSRTRMMAVASGKLLSWGEMIDIELFPDLMLTITSKCKLPTQCIDWGKNRRNVRKFLIRLEEFLEET